MNKSFAKKASIATLGVVTVLSLSMSSVPAFAKGHASAQAKGHGKQTSASSQPMVSQLRHGGRTLKLGVPTMQGNESNVAVQTADLAFTVTGVPAIITDPAQIAGNIVFKVVPLPADATSAPTTPPTLAPMPHKYEGRYKFGSRNTSPLTLNAGTISGAIKIRGLRSGAGIQNLAVYPFLAADNRSGLAAQTGTAVFVEATTATDGTVTLSGQSGALTLDLSLNTGTIKTAQTVIVNVPNDGKNYALQIVRTDVLDEHGNLVADPKIPVVATLGLSGSGALTVTLPDLKPGNYTFNLIQLVAQNTGVSIGVDGALSAPLTIG